MSAFRTLLALLVVIALAVVAGALAHVAGYGRAGDIIWAATIVVALIPLVLGIVRDLLAKQAGVDVIAVLAMAGALALGEFLAGAIIALMYATGEVLEAYAGSRAERELSALLKRAPRTANRIEADEVVVVSVKDVQRGDRLLVREADVIPVDGVITSDGAVIDASALTGESVPLRLGAGDHVESGAVNAGAPFEMRATATAEASTYAGIVRLVSAARGTRAPSQRIADRYAAYFIPLTLAVAGVAWLIAGDPVRALAVLVVATPCPLLLAAPIAIVSGISRSANRGIIIKGGGALETLAQGNVLLIDKTGTLTTGTPRVSGILTTGGWHDEDELLRLAASVDQVSSHVLAEALVQAARERGLALDFPDDAREDAGQGIEGTIGGRTIRVGQIEWAGEGGDPDEHAAFRRRVAHHLGSTIAIGVDGSLAGAILVDDPIRPDTPRAIRALRRRGIGEVVMVTGDHPAVAEAVGAALGVDRVLAGQSPAQKLEAVDQLGREHTTLMVGDGINDAPALAAADVGIAMGARGATASSEAADVVLTVDRLDRLVEAIGIAQRSRRVALEAVLVGMGLSLVAMVFAAAGYLPPVAGALLQEGIDVVAIAIALRALSGGTELASKPRIPADLSARLKADHDGIIPELVLLRRVADELGEVPQEVARAAVEDARDFIERVILPHEQEDELVIYPEVAKALPGDDPLASMSRSHQEIFRLAHALIGRVDALAPEGPDEAEEGELRALLYSLHAILQLHFAQEEELYLSLDDRYLDRTREEMRAA